MGTQERDVVFIHVKPLYRRHYVVGDVPPGENPLCTGEKPLCQYDGEEVRRYRVNGSATGALEAVRSLWRKIEGKLPEDIERPDSLGDGLPSGEA